MKRLFLLNMLLLFIGNVFAQVKQPVHWRFSAKKINATTYEVHLTGDIEKGWHTYSQNTPEGGPMPTALSFVTNPLIILQGRPKEVGRLEQHHEPLFGVDVRQYSNKIDFVQTVTLKAPAKTSLKGTVEFMVCNDRECFPPTSEKFSIDLR